VTDESKFIRSGLRPFFDKLFFTVRSTNPRVARSDVVRSAAVTRLVKQLSDKQFVTLDTLNDHDEEAMFLLDCSIRGEVSCFIVYDGEALWAAVRTSDADPTEYNVVTEWFASTYRNLNLDDKRLLDEAVKAFTEEL
jgi:aspartate oxidase